MIGKLVAVAVVMVTALGVLGWALWVADDQGDYCQQKLGYGAIKADSDYCYPPPVRVPDMPGWLP